MFALCKIFLLRLAPCLHLCLTPASLNQHGKLLMVHNPDWAMRASIFCALSAVMTLLTCFQIYTRPAVQRSIAAPCKVKVMGHWYASISDQVPFGSPPSLLATPLEAFGGAFASVTTKSGRNSTQQMTKTMGRKRLLAPRLLALLVARGTLLMSKTWSEHRKVRRPRASAECASRVAAPAGVEPALPD